MSHNSYSQEPDIEKVTYYLEQFTYYEYMDWDSAKIYLDSAVEQSEGSTDNMLLGKVNLSQGWYYQDISEFDTSRSYFFKALDYYTLANSYNKIADTYGNIGNAYLDVRDLKSALEYQLKSLETNESIILMSGDDQAIESAIHGRAYAWSNISNIYMTLGQYSKALGYERQALNYELEGEDSVGMAISYVSLGTIYDDLNIRDSALQYTQLAHGIFERFSYSNGLINTNIFLYKYSLEAEEPELDYLLEAYQITRDFQDAYSEVYALGFLISGDFGFSKDSVSRMVKRGHQILEEYDLQGSMYRFYLDEAKFLAKSGNYEGGFNSLSKYIDLFSDRKETNEGVDFENAELRHEYQLQSLTDSLAFESTLNDHKVENERAIGRQRTILTISVFGGLVLGIFLIFVYRALKVKKKTNSQLSEKNNLIERQKELVEEKNKEITDSITYAKRLQSAILPPFEMLHGEFTDSFVHYRPKDVVSGDFYWIEKQGDLIFIAAADCTGHGVPGAMVSVVCSNALNRSVNEFKLSSPAKILNKTRDLVITTFAKSGDNVKDGMDICLCAFDRKSKNVVFAGANNPLWIVRENRHLTEEELASEAILTLEGYSMIEIKSSKQPVGLYEGMKDFMELKLEAKEGDTFYLFTDGYADQFGGEKGKKLKYKNFKKLLLENAQRTGEEQNKILDTFMNEWKRDYEQLDDICVIGVRI